MLFRSLLVLPLALLPARLRRPLVQSLISATFRLFLGGCCACGLMRLDLRELDALNARPGGLLMVANHPSMIDVFLVLSRVRHALCLMKADLGTNPFLAVGARLAGYVSNRHAEGLIRQGAQALREGLLTVFCRHTSASLVIQENAAPAVRRDMEAYFARLAPESGAYEHDDEGPDDMPAHLQIGRAHV